MFMVCESLPDTKEDILECSQSSSHLVSSCTKLLYNQRLSQCTTWDTFFLNHSNTLAMQLPRLVAITCKRSTTELFWKRLSAAVQRFDTQFQYYCYCRPEKYLKTFYNFFHFVVMLLRFIVCPQGSRAVFLFFLKSDMKIGRADCAYTVKEAQTSSRAGPSFNTI